MRVLLVDHDSESLEAITRAIRGVLELDCVTSKGDALLLLRQNQYDVLIACERAVDGSGLDLLGRTTRTAQPLKRIFAAAPERLQLLGPRLAPFKVQRTINYPIDLEELWLAIAQVTGGPNDETDGTIERVVLDERGLASEGTTPRGPIPPRPPAPLGNTPPPPPPPPPTPTLTATMSASAASGRFATARATQPAPEPPLRAPPPPRQPPPQVRAPAPPAAPSDTGRMRAVAPPPAPSETGRMRALAPPPATSETGRMRALAPPMKPVAPMPVPPMNVEPPPPAPALPAWTPEPLGMSEDEFAQISAQARLGVQQRTVDDAARRKKLRLAMAGGVALVVAGAIVFLIERFYDPEERAREAAIAATVQQMAEQQKVTDNLTLIEIDIENAIMNNDLDTARRELAKLVERKPDHPRREFLQNAIDRSAAVAKLSPQNPAEPPASGPQQAAVVSSPNSSRPAATQRPRAPERTPERVATRTTERTTPPRTQRDETPSTNNQRTYGAPIGEAPRQSSIPLDAPINTPPSTAARRNDNSFVGRTLEASDSATLARPPQATPTSTVNNPAPSMAGSAVSPAPAPVEPAASPAGETAAVDVVPAKVIKRVTPVAPFNIPKKTSGYVVLSFTIGTNGRVSGVSIVESTPPGVFDDAAMSAVRKWTYEPRKENGVAVESQSKARLVFAPAE
jgi:TonB family protein